MKSKALILAGLLACTGLAACFTDPFSIKPEVNVTLPDKPADSEAPADEDAVAPETPAETDA